MKKLLFILVILGVGAAYAGLSYHFILFDDKVKIIKKTNYSFKNTLVDARGAKALYLLKEPDLIEAGIREFLGQSKGTTIPTKP